VALLLLVLGLLREVADPQEAVRLRDSLLAEPGSPADFVWTPDSMPASFLRNEAPPPEPIARAAREVVTGSGGFAAGLEIARHLAEVPHRQDPIQRSTAETYRVMRTMGGGYCADFTQVFVGLALAAGVPVREWGLSFDGFGGDGHAIVEVYDENLARWTMLDPFNAFYPVDPASGEPMSVLEFRQRLTLPDPLAAIRIVRYAPAAFQFRDDQNLIDYFRRGVDQFYLWWGTNLFSYEQAPLVRAAGRVSRAAEQGIAILAGIHPRIVMYPTGTNQALMAAGRGVRLRTLTYVEGIALLSLLLVLQLFLLLWRRAG
jgi:hypothetical protein